MKNPAPTCRRAMAVEFASLAPAHVQRYWSREVPGEALDHDIVRLPTAAVADGIFAAGLE